VKDHWGGVPWISMTKLPSYMWYWNHTGLIHLPSKMTHGSPSFKPEIDLPRHIYNSLYHFVQFQGVHFDETNMEVAVTSLTMFNSKKPIDSFQWSIFKPSFVGNYQRKSHKLKLWGHQKLLKSLQVNTMLLNLRMFLRNWINMFPYKKGNQMLNFTLTRKRWIFQLAMKQKCFLGKHVC